MPSTNQRTCVWFVVFVLPSCLLYDRPTEHGVKGVTKMMMDRYTYVFYTLMIHSSTVNDVYICCNIVVHVFPLATVTVYRFQAWFMILLMMKMVVQTDISQSSMCCSVCGVIQGTIILLRTWICIFLTDSVCVLCACATSLSTAHCLFCFFVFLWIISPDDL